MFTQAHKEKKADAKGIYREAVKDQSPASRSAGWVRGLSRFFLRQRRYTTLGALESNAFGVKVTGEICAREQIICVPSGSPAVRAVPLTKTSDDY